MHAIEGALHRLEKFLSLDRLALILQCQESKPAARRESPAMEERSPL
jgi:hypothetical protein